MSHSQSDAFLSGDAIKARFFAGIIDNMAAMGVSFLIAAQLSIIGKIAQGLSVFALYCLYFFMAEALLAMTPGKFAFGLRVVSVSGRNCTTWQVFLRTILRIVEVNPLLLGYLPAGIAILTSKRHQRFGDMLAGTVVISHRQLKRLEPSGVHCQSDQSMTLDSSDPDISISP